MMLWLKSMVVILALQFSFGSQCKDEISPITDNCIGCICEQATECSVFAECSGANLSWGPMCGPLKIGKKFAREYGNCTLEGDDPVDDEGKGPV